MALTRSRVRGGAKMRRLLKRMPEAVQGELVAALSSAGPVLEAAIEARTPKRFGRLRAGLSHKVFPKTLKLEVGLLGTKKGRAKLFYGRILEFGRKAQTVTVTRAPNFKNAARRAAGASAAPYTMRVKAIAPVRYVTGSLKDARTIIGRELQGIWDRSLGRVTESGID